MRATNTLWQQGRVISRTYAPATLRLVFGQIQWLPAESEVIISVHVSIPMIWRSISWTCPEASLQYQKCNK